MYFSKSIFRNLFLEIYSYTTVMVMCPKQKETENCSQVEIEILIVKGRNLPSTNSTKCENQNLALTYISLKENKLLLCILFNDDILKIITY